MAEALRHRLLGAFAVWARLLPYLAPQRGRLAGAGALMLLAVAVELAKPWPIKVVIDQVLLGNEWPLLPASWHGDAVALTTAAIVATVLLAAVGGVAALWRDLWLADAGQRAVGRVRRHALDAVLHQSLAFHERMGFHEVGQQKTDYATVALLARPLA